LITNCENISIFFK